MAPTVLDRFRLDGRVAIVMGMLAEAKFTHIALVTDTDVEPPKPDR